MTPETALALVGELRPPQFAPLWDAATPVAATELRRGLWHGRNGGMPAPLKWFTREVMRRDYFAKLVFDDFGINVRVRQDGTWSPRPSRAVPDGVVVDMPFGLGADGLDYGFHVTGFDVATRLQLRDVLRTIDLATLAELAPEADLRRIGAAPGEGGDGEVVLGKLLPLAAAPLASAPFAMAWQRAATAAEEASARAHLERRRLFDSSVAVVG